MCGIAGVFSMSPSDRSEQVLKVMVKAVEHRGPDGLGIYISPNRQCYLGHTRLSILDLSEGGHQPMIGRNERYVVTYNGEIYNYLEVKRELEMRGHSFQSNSDTEVLLAAFLEWGADCLAKFNGMWAFVVYDTRENSIFAARDRYGVKPLYYHFDQGQLLISSEVQAIHKALGSSHPLNDSVIRMTASGSFDSHGSDLTYLSKVYALPAGHFLKLGSKSTGPQISRWYNLVSVQIPKTYRQQVEALRELIFDSCRLRMRSDVEVATCLSGGIDSGSITAVITELAKGNAKASYQHQAFCASFPNTPLDELKEARSLADKLGVKLHVLEVVPPTVEQLEASLESCDGPMHALAFYPIWSLYKFIKERGISVTLDGQGPDEMLGGYRPLAEGLRAARELGDWPWYFDLYRTYGNMGETSQFSSKRFAREILAKDFLRGESAKNLRAQLVGSNFTNSLDKSLHHQFFQSPLPGILQQYDRCSMSSGVECRMPFMDYRIVEFIFSLDPRAKVGHSFTKRILRDSMRGVVPSATLDNRRKIGFNAPIVDWFQGGLRNWMLDITRSKEFNESSYFDGAAMSKEFSTFVDKPDAGWNEAWKFWPAVHLTYWLAKNKSSGVKDGLSADRALHV